MSEAVDAIGNMLTGYPVNLRAQADKGYIGTIAGLLLSYPRAIALDCTHPITGIARDCNFLPSVSNMVQWLERQVQSMRTVSDWEARSRKQQEERAERERDEKAEPLEHRRKIAARIKRELTEAFAAGKGEVYNVFVPTFAPQYQAMVERGGRSGVSLEDSARTGVWVPARWLQGSLQASDTWRRLTGDELLAKYPPPRVTDIPWDDEAAA